jgi:hypothetical protein
MQDTMEQLSIKDFVIDNQDMGCCYRIIVILRQLHRPSPDDDIVTASSAGIQKTSTLTPISTTRNPVAR